MATVYVSVGSTKSAKMRATNIRHYGIIIVSITEYLEIAGRFEGIARMFIRRKK